MRSPSLAPLVLAVLAQGVGAQTRPTTAPARERPPHLAFPEPGLDDTAAYRGYRTRFWQDAAGNTLQVYLDDREGRVVHLWADAENESLGFSARGADDAPAALRWDAPVARVSAAGRARTLEYRMAAAGRELRVGWFLLGSMRVERDFQGWKKHRAPFSDPPFRLEETERLFAALERLPDATRRAHLRPLGVSDVAALRARVRPRLTAGPEQGSWVVRVVQHTLDGRDSLALELRADPRTVTATRAGDAIIFRARSGDAVPLTVRVTTTGAALTPLSRDQIFTPAFTAFAAAAAREPGDAAAASARRTERQMRGVELLASREKLMAGLPTYATYFGRDQLVTALMMRPIWRPDVPAAVVASVLRKLSPTGQVSHEEALGGQAVREAAAEYAALVDSALAPGAGRADADRLLARAATVLAEHRRVRENYHMIDDELQLPVLAARWLADSAIPAAQRRAFLRDARDAGEPRAARLLRELALVARMTAPYASDPRPANLIGFARRDSTRWAALSWRDSGVGYADGRYAMDVNAIWAPHALEAIATILDAMDRLGFARDSLLRATPELAAGTPLGDWARDPAALRRATETWWGAARHFLVQLSAEQVHERVAARLDAMPEAERAHWRGVLTRTAADRRALEFLALALDADGRPIGVANSDPATRLFLGEPLLRSGAADSAARAAVLRDVRLFARAYPVGLLVDGVGPVVANDAYATPPVWRAFAEDLYHSPRAVWGREVNLFLLGVAHHVRLAGGATPADSSQTAYVRELLDAAAAVEQAVAASGFHSELWSYDFPQGRLTPVRYGSGADVQLWSTTDLAVRFAMHGLR